MVILLTDRQLWANSFISSFVGGNYACMVLVCSAPLAPEIIPPVTRMVTYSKSKPLRSKSGPVQSPTSDTGSRSVGGADINRGWTGGEFTPANQLPASDQSSARTKRYSTQRLRGVAGDSGVTDAAHVTCDSASPTSLGTATRLVNATSMVHVPSRAVPSSAYYGTYIHSSYLRSSIVSLVNGLLT